MPRPWKSLIGLAALSGAAVFIWLGVERPDTSIPPGALATVSDVSLESLRASEQTVREYQISRGQANRADAEAGDARAQLALGLYLDREGEAGESRAWLERAADQGEIHAMLELSAKLGAAEPAEAYKWAELAARTEREHALRRMEALQRELDPAIVYDGHRRAVAWLDARPELASGRLRRRAKDPPADGD